MSDTTSTMKKAAEEMTQEDKIDDLQKELCVEGTYNVVVEGGYHQQKLTDEDADSLTQLIVDHGVLGLMTLAKDEYTDSKRNLAQIKPLVSTTGASFEEIESRLDDGNEYPGYYLEFDNEMNVYTLYEEGYD